MAQTIVESVMTALERHASHSDAAFLQRFFKTGAGQYGAGDVFIGVRMPQIRAVAKTFREIALGDIEQLLESPVHEARLCAVVIMAEQSRRASRVSADQAKALYDLYLKRTDRINNWDIVDISCRDVVGQYVMDHPESRSDLRHLAKSRDIWERRIAMVSTWQFIRKGQLDETFEIAALLLDDKHDLIHKAVGWMLRSAGDKDGGRLREFLTQNIQDMPRTALRYAIEHFSPEERQYFLKLK